MAKTDIAVGGTWIPATCSRADLAMLFGVSTRTITDLVSRGIVVQAEQHNMYQTLPSVTAYLEDLRNKAAGRSKDSALAEERAKQAAIEREISQIKLSQLKGEVLTLEEVVAGWSSILAFVKSAMLAVPAQLRAQIPHFGAHEQETARLLVREVLNGMADEIEIGVAGTHTGDLRSDD